MVARSGAASAPFNITLAAYAPGLEPNLTPGGDSKSALLLDGNSFKPVTQVKPGDIVIAFGTGLGATNPAAVTGVPAASNEVCVTSPQLTLGGVAFAPLFCGVVAGQIGAYQLNLKIPTVPGGTQPLVLTIGSVSSPPLNVNVAGSGPAVTSVAPTGSFGFLLNASYIDPSNYNGAAMLGVMNFDGAGNVTGSYTLHGGATGPGPDQAAQTRTGTFTGSYSSNPDGTGSVTIFTDVGASQTFAMVITDGGQGLQLVSTNCSSGCGQTLFSGAARAAHPGSLKGSYGFQANNSPGPGATVGVISFDGAGNATASFSSVGVGNGGSQPSVSSGTATGTYSINPDGSGTIHLTNASDQFTFAIVVTDGGSELLMLVTNDPGSGVSFGPARLQ